MIAETTVKEIMKWKIISEVVTIIIGQREIVEIIKTVKIIQGEQIAI
jgi:hypothetical protein